MELFKAASCGARLEIWLVRTGFEKRMTPIRYLLPLAAILVVAIPSVCRAADPSLCMRCHNDSSSIAPGLSGMSKADFLESVKAFKSGAREHPIMRNFALSLSDKDVMGLATHFSGLKAAVEAKADLAPSVR
jgi:cytochrome c553